MTNPTSEGAGRRERKKNRTRSAIQDAALRLFREQGYAATTVRQIAEEVDISQQTFFRYFPTKADTVIQGHLDPVLAAAFADQPAELRATAAFRAALQQGVGVLSDEEIELETARRALIAEMDDFPAVISAHIQSSMGLYVAALAQRSGRSSEDPAVRTWVGAMSGIAISCYLTWASNPNQISIFDLIDESMAMLDDGIPI